MRKKRAVAAARGRAHRAAALCVNSKRGFNQLAAANGVTRGDGKGT
jgi:hypothetical protein